LEEASPFSSVGWQLMEIKFVPRPLPPFFFSPRWIRVLSPPPSLIIPSTASSGLPSFSLGKHPFSFFEVSQHCLVRTVLQPRLRFWGSFYDTFSPAKSGFTHIDFLLLLTMRSPSLWGFQKPSWMVKLSYPSFILLVFLYFE